MTVYNIKRFQKVFVIDYDRIQEGEIHEFIDPQNNNNWVVKLITSSKFLNCIYNENAFFTYQKALNVLQAKRIQENKLEKEKQLQKRIKEFKKEKLYNKQFAVGQNIYFIDKKNFEIRQGVLTNVNGEIWIVEVLYKNEKEKIERNNIFSSFTEAQKKCVELGIQITLHKREWSTDWSEYDAHY